MHCHADRCADRCARWGRRRRIHWRDDIGIGCVDSQLATQFGAHGFIKNIYLWRQHVPRATNVARGGVGRGGGQNLKVPDNP